MDPTTLLYLNKTEIKEIEANLVEEFKNSISQDLQETQKNDFEPNLVADQKKKKNNINSFGKKYGLPISKLVSKPSEVKAIQDEILNYKKQVSSNELDFSKFWKNNASNMPKLASAVRKYCIIQASSVSVESSFSEANFIQRKERSSLSSKTLRYSITLKSTKRIFKNIKF